MMLFTESMRDVCWLIGMLMMRNHLEQAANPRPLYLT